MSDFSTRRVPGLDLVRSAAIIFVVISHYFPLYERFPTASPLKFLGVLGVELFFVLSGFLIGGILLRQADELRDQGDNFKIRDAPGFWIRRWFRTLPNYLLFFAAFLLFDEPWTKDHWRAWILSAFFSQNLFADLSDGTFGIAWSLCVEEWLYIFLPLLLAAYTLRTRNCGQAALLSAVTLIVVPTILRCTTTGKSWDLGVRHIVIYRLDAIAYGVLLAYLARYRRSAFQRLAGGRWAVAGVIVLIAISLHYLEFGGNWIDANEARSGIKWFIMSVAFFSAVSIAIIPIVAWASQLASLPWGVSMLVYRTSLYSYSMYLSHSLVFYFSSFLVYRVVSQNFGEFRGLTFVMIGLNLIGLYVVSGGIYHVWEAPLTRLRERFTASPVSPRISASTDVIPPSL